jgi:tau tubulin kinase
VQAESNVIKKLQDMEFAARHIHFGQHRKEGKDGKELKHDVLVMQLLGPNMSQIRHKQASQSCMGVGICAEFSLQMLACVRSMHELGFIHRDIKPSNFARGRLGSAHERKFFVIDFGLSRKLRERKDKGKDKSADKDKGGKGQAGKPELGDMKPERPQADFRGTSLYASPTAHLNRDLSWKDDLW